MNFVFKNVIISLAPGGGLILFFPCVSTFCVE